MFSGYLIKAPVHNSIKICPAWAELFLAIRRTDGRRHITKLTVAFHKFATAAERKVSQSVNYLRLSMRYANLLLHIFHCVSFCSCVCSSLRMAT